MRCEDCRELLWAYLEKETTAEETEKVEEHLAACADCREELDAVREMKKALQSLPDEALPEGYHTELMQKLQAEAAPNVVPFPAKKKAPKWKQLSMIAAAALVVVAAGGINGMLDMRQSQNEAVQKMEVTTDDTMVAYDAGEPMEGMTIEETTDDAAVEYQVDTSSATSSNEKKRSSASPVADGVDAGAMPAQTKNKAAVMEEATVDMAAVPETASVTTEETAPFSVKRSAAETTDIAILLVADEKAAIAEIQKAIAEAGGYEEAFDGDDVSAMIPVENYGDFVKKLEALGELEWMKQGNLAADADYRSVGIRLKLK